MTRHEVLENLSVALDTLRARKVRSGLTILGIVIGVTTVIAVASIIDGLNGVIKERVQRLGSNTLFVTRIPPGRIPAGCRRRSACGNIWRTTMRHYLKESSPGGFLRDGVRATGINFNEQADEMRYGDAHVERFCPARRGAGLHRRLPAVRGRRGALHLALSTKSTRATWL